ncbi:MAG: hypothetical protein CME15_07510 [Gemmatimonadetes bacterium]|nr:hypothetical protein [Gemmatimonadota bacterium]
MRGSQHQLTPIGRILFKPDFLYVQLVQTLAAAVVEIGLIGPGSDAGATRCPHALDRPGAVGDTADCAHAFIPVQIFGDPVVSGRIVVLREVEVHPVAVSHFTREGDIET